MAALQERIFSNQSCKKVLVWYSTAWCHCPAQPPGAPVELEVWILGVFLESLIHFLSSLALSCFFLCF